MIPTWLNNVIREFGERIGLENFALNSDGVAAFRFENEVDFKLEYSMDVLAVSMSVELSQNVDAAKRLLAISDPLRREMFPIHTGIAGDPSRAIFALRIQTSDVTLENIELAMTELWRAIEYFKRSLIA